ncbi:hypothetical protein NA56DRAFT_323371 [Hyaloscypha hepaticicola]|uniref:C2H2-type domain-containing protein n=1 Tax=Hyaloscypha hepaticicola TaxID=2082293 RepID=A0A2J6PPD7_9HELO|nr:hypothetical protein NA56DRAFT_323371 [Hyaloscypha hepaticicola]
MPTIMAQLASDTNSEGRIDNALLTRNSISNRSGFTSQPHADPSIPSEIFISPSRSRAMTESEVQKSQRPKHEKPKSASICSLSDETRQLLYTWHPFHKDPEMPKDQGSTSKPRYVEKASYADGDSDPEPEGITTPTREWGHQLTPLTNTSSESEYCEPQKVLASENPDRDVRPGPEELSMHAPTASEAIQDADASIKVDDWQSKVILLSGCSSGEDDDMEDDEHELLDSEDDYFEERWVSTDKEFEATVFHATGNDFCLAARLIPQLYEMFRQEESSVVGFWEMCYRQRVGNSYGQGPGEQGGSAGPRRSDASPTTRLRKRLRENDDGDGEGADNNQDGDKNDDGNTEEHIGSPKPPPFACPFNKKYPSFYNGLHRSPDTRKGEYKTCQLGYDTEQRFKEHLSRLHRCVQCEKCSQKFTGPIKTRQVNFQKHLSLGDCRNAPPDILEGLTELQWAEIEALPSQPRSAATIGKPKARKLNVIRWNDVWQIIFPRENPPEPCKFQAFDI